MKNFLIMVGFCASTAAFGATTYLIEHSSNDELFIINGEVYKAKTYCFNMRQNDKVLFLEGSPFGACATAKLYNLRTKESCEVWCE